MDKKKILVASHERSGTHFLINTIAENFGYSPNYVDIYQSSKHSLSKQQGPSVSSPTAYKKQDPGLILKSHHSYPVIKDLVSEIEDEFHILYIVRDGRDVLTSFWRYLNSVAPGWGPRVDSIGNFLRARPAGEILQYQHRESPTMLQRWIDHSKSWESANHEVIFFSYEELYTGFNATVDRLAGILNREVTHIKRPGLDSPSSLPWKGIIGNWKDYFSDADTAYFNTHTENLGLHTYEQEEK